MQINFSLPRLGQNSIRLERKAAMIISFEISRHELASLLSSDRSQKVFVLGSKVKMTSQNPRDMDAHAFSIYFFLFQGILSILSLNKKLFVVCPCFASVLSGKIPAKPSTKAGYKAQRPPSGAELE